jgi:hypothetical protein
MNPRGRIVPPETPSVAPRPFAKIPPATAAPGTPDAPALRPARFSRPRRPPGRESPTSVRSGFPSFGAPAWLPSAHLGCSENPPASPMPIFMNRGAAQRHGGSLGAPRWLRSARPFPPSRTGFPPRRWVRSAQLHGVALKGSLSWIGVPRSSMAAHSARRVARKDADDRRSHAFTQP